MTEDEFEVTADGYLIRCSDGEVIGLAPATDRFRVTDRDSADWVLRKLSEAEANVLSIQAQRRAVNERLDAMERDARRRAEYLRFRFGRELAEFARVALSGLKSRTLNLPHGSIAFRSTKGTNRITDPDAAVAFVESVAPERVKVAKSVTVTTALEVYRAWKGDSNTTPPWIESSGPRETVAIETGIGLAGGKTPASATLRRTDT